MNLIQPVLIMSAYQVDHLQFTNKQSHRRLIALLQAAKASYATVEGCVSGTEEVSVLLAWSEANEALVRDLSAAFGQESYLYVDANRQGSLYQPNGKLLGTLGTMKSSPDKPLGLDYSKVGDNYFYFDEV